MCWQVQRYKTSVGEVWQAGKHGISKSTMCCVLSSSSFLLKTIPLGLTVSSTVFDTVPGPSVSQRRLFCNRRRCRSLSLRRGRDIWRTWNVKRCKPRTQKTTPETRWSSYLLRTKRRCSHTRARLGLAWLFLHMYEDESGSRKRKKGGCGRYFL